MSERRTLYRSDLASALWLLRREFIVVGVFSMVVNALMLAPSLYMLQIYDRVMLSRSGFTLTASTLVLVFLLVVVAFAEWARTRLLVRIGVRLDTQLNERLFNASFDAQLERHRPNPGQAFGDLTNIRQFLTGNGIFAFFDAPWIPIYIGVIFLLHPVLGWMAIIFACVLAGLAWFSHWLTSAPIEDAQHAGLAVNAYLQGKLRNAEVIEGLGMLENLRRRWWRRYLQQRESLAKVERLGFRITATSKFLRYCYQSLTLGAAGLLVIEGEISVGSMIAANILMSRALQPIDTIVGTWRAFVAARAAYHRLGLLLDEQRARVPGIYTQVPFGRIQLENLVASVPGRPTPILNGISLEIPAGSLVAVIGPSGSGKSTLARALLGIWPHVEGKVLLDSEPIANWDRAALGPNLGYLPQDVELFDGTLAENIARLGTVDAARVIEAARRAGVHDMILRFPRGYDTSAGEAGGLLSAGQKQRVALARALYGDPALVVLDEPNANLDEAGEDALVKAVEDLKARGKTVILITHRRNIVAVADRILALRGGTVQLYGDRDAILAEHAAGARPPASTAPNPA